jgi:hypothetical protein
MIKELQILVEVEKALKLISSINIAQHKSAELKSHLEKIRDLQLQSFVENETYNFVLTDALEEKERERASQNNRSTNVTTYISRH